MLTPRQLEDIPETMLRLWAQVEADILADMAIRISAYDMFIPAAEHQFRRLQEMGLMYDDIVERLSAITGKSNRELRKIITEAVGDSLEADAVTYKRAGLTPAAIDASPEVQSILMSGIQNTQGLFDNLTRTTANTATRQFENALDRAWMKVSTGAFSHTEAVRSAIKELSARGVEAVTYPSGHTDAIDVAVRRAVLTGVNQATLKAQEALADEMQCDLVEVTAHAGARVGDGGENAGNHSWWQGKVYSRSGTHPKYPSLVEVTGYGSGEGLGGWNCRHNMRVFIEGISEPTYTQAELEALNAPMYDYNGKKLTEYEATQRQRYIERQIRRWRREEMAMKAAGLPADEARAKVSRWQKTQRDFLDQTGLKRQYDRERVEKPLLVELERAAIARYTSAEAYPLNAKLRAGDPLDGPERHLAESLDKALGKMPKYEGTVYRSVSDFGIENMDAFLLEHSLGAEVKYSAFTSAATRVYDESFPIQFIIKSTSGRDIRELNQAEMEILFERGATFRIVRRDGMTIYMEQV